MLTVRICKPDGGTSWEIKAANKENLSVSTANEDEGWQKHADDVASDVVGRKNGGKKERWEGIMPSEFQQTCE